MTCWCKTTSPWVVARASATCIHPKWSRIMEAKARPKTTNMPFEHEGAQPEPDIRKVLCRACRGDKCPPDASTEATGWRVRTCWPYVFSRETFRDRVGWPPRFLRECGVATRFVLCRSSAAAGFWLWAHLSVVSGAHFGSRGTSVPTALPLARYGSISSSRHVLSYSDMVGERERVLPSASLTSAAGVRLSVWRCQGGGLHCQLRGDHQHNRAEKARPLEAPRSSRRAFAHLGSGGRRTGRALAPSPLQLARRAPWGGGATRCRIGSVGVERLVSALDCATSGRAGRLMESASSLVDAPRVAAHGFQCEQGQCGTLCPRPSGPRRYGGARRTSRPPGVSPKLAIGVISKRIGQLEGVAPMCAGHADSLQPCTGTRQ